MFKRLAFRLVNKGMFITALVLGVAVLLLGLFIGSWSAAAPGFLLFGFGLGMLFNGTEQRKANQKAYDEAYPPSNWRISDN